MPKEAEIPLNPRLPRNFSSTPNDARPKSHEKWFNVPYIETQEFWGTDADSDARPLWLKAWPSGTRYDVRCLDGGAWDRPTCWGQFATLEEAQACARSGPRWLSKGVKP